MNDHELRNLARDIVARRLSRRTGDSGPATAADETVATDRQCEQHASHGMYVTLINVGEACLIEPAVPCNHCGYCRSHGH